MFRNNPILSFLKPHISASLFVQNVIVQPNFPESLFSVPLIAAYTLVSAKNVPVGDRRTL